jgi:hypothetical protein
MAQEADWKIGSIVVPRSGPANGVYISELQTDNFVNSKAFVARQTAEEVPPVFLPAQLLETKADPYAIRNGQLVKYWLYPESSLVQEFELL